jgi:NADH-quinone oxidoreductase subunit I
MYRAPNGKWYPGIRYGQCVLIHFCIDACPVDALKPTPIHDMAFPDMDSAKFRPEEMGQLPRRVEDAEYVVKYDIVGGRLVKIRSKYNKGV